MKTKAIHLVTVGLTLVVSAPVRGQGSGGWDCALNWASDSPGQASQRTRARRFARPRFARLPDNHPTSARATARPCPRRLFSLKDAGRCLKKSPAARGKWACGGSACAANSGVPGRNPKDRRRQVVRLPAYPFTRQPVRRAPIRIDTDPSPSPVGIDTDPSPRTNPVRIDTDPSPRTNPVRIDTDPSPRTNPVRIDTDPSPRTNPVRIDTDPSPQPNPVRTRANPKLRQLRPRTLALPGTHPTRQRAPLTRTTPPRLRRSPATLKGVPENNIGWRQRRQQQRDRRRRVAVRPEQGQPARPAGDHPSSYRRQGSYDHLLRTWRLRGNR